MRDALIVLGVATFTACLVVASVYVASRGSEWWETFADKVRTLVGGEE